LLIKCPPERHIAVEFSDIFRELNKSYIPLGEQEAYKRVAELIESLYAQKFMAQRRSLKTNFLMFSVGAKDQILPAKVGKSLPNKTDLDDKELKLVNDIMQLMAAARFHIMTEEEWDLSLNEDFKFYLPVEINYSFFEQRLLSRFWASEPERAELRTVLSDVADKMLVFHRGIGVAQDSGMFFQEKLDLLVEYCVAEPVKAAWENLKAYLPAMFQSGEAALKRADANSWTRAPSVGDAAARNLHGRDGSEAGSPRDILHVPGRYQRRATETNEGEALDKPHRNARIVERRSLKILMPSASQVIANAFKTIKLQEPMFKEVVVVYRSSPQGRAADKPAPNRPGFGKDNTTRLRHILNRRNIHIKYFHDIPMADIEAIFPDKIVYSKTISRISMVVQAVIAFVAAIATMWQAGALSLQTIWSVLTLVGVRAGQMYSRMQFERSRVMQEMVNILYDKMLDAQEGVLSMLLEDMAEQQLKEAMLAYTLLLTDKVNMTAKALDDRCEKYLEHTYACRIDFAVEDALPQLVEWGLVTADKTAHPYVYRAVSVDKAHKALTDLWNKAFEASSESITPDTKPLYSLLPRGEKDLQRAGISEGVRFSSTMSEVSEEDRSSRPAEKTVLTPDGKIRSVPHKHSRGPIHKINKTLKHIFSDGTSGKASSKGSPRPSDSGAGAIPSSARSSMSGAAGGPPLALAPPGRTLPAGPAALPATSQIPAPPAPLTIQESAREGEAAAK